MSILYFCSDVFCEGPDVIVDHEEMSRLYAVTYRSKKQP